MLITLYALTGSYEEDLAKFSHVYSYVIENHNDHSGDSNLDGKVNAADALIALKIAVKGYRISDAREYYNCLLQTYYNNSLDYYEYTDVSAADALLILQKSVHLAG